MTTSEPTNVDFSKVHLLGWYDLTGRAQLTSWCGSQPMVMVVAYANDYRMSMSMWGHHNEYNVKLESFDESIHTPAWLQQHDARKAFGWVLE